MKKIFASVAAVVVGAVALPASAQTVSALNAFGAQGTFAIDAQGGVQLYAAPGGVGSGGFVRDYGLTPFVGWSFRKNSEQSNPTADTNTFRTSAFYLNPGVDYFVIDHLSIGGEVIFALTGDSVTTHNPRTGADTTRDAPDGSGVHLGIMPRVGYDIPLSAMFSIWPRGGIGWRHASFSGGGAADASLSSWIFFADVPFVFHPVEHFFIGVGPGVTFTLSASASSGGLSRDLPTYTEFRILSTTIGGYL